MYLFYLFFLETLPVAHLPKKLSSINPTPRPQAYVEIPTLGHGFFFFLKHAPLQLGNTTCYFVQYNVFYRGDVLLTHFTSPLGHVVFVIVGQSLLILQRLERSPDAS